MKKWFGYLLSLYILLCTVVPCTLLDECTDEPNTEQTSHNDTRKDCNSCSPFSVCSSYHGFTLITILTNVAPAGAGEPPACTDYCFSSTFGYYSTLFQPPRTGS